MLKSCATPLRAHVPRKTGVLQETSRNRAFATLGTRRPRLASAKTFRVAAKLSGSRMESSSEETLEVENGCWRVEPASIQRARDTLRKISEFAGTRMTDGIGETHLDAALRRDHDLIRAIDDAGSLHDRLVHSQGLCGGRCYATLLSLDEPDLRHRLTKDVLNFYPRDGIQPFVPLAARGPWIVTSHGAIVYDAAGYGMTGFGHSPDNLLAAVAKPEVMANVMTSSFAQADLTHALRREIGRKWKGVKGARRMISDEKDAEDDEAAWTNQLEPPYVSFACLNSGSEAVTLALRVTDAAARSKLDADEGKIPVFISLKGSFHGRTDRAAAVSHATHGLYVDELASFRPGLGERGSTKGAFDVEKDFFRVEKERELDDLIEGLVDECDSDFAHPFYDSWKDCWQIKQQRDDTEARVEKGGLHLGGDVSPPPCLFVEPNDVSALKKTFDACDRAGLFVEAMILEPCMGEGDPGRRITREFYDEARKLTSDRETFLIVDSVQAGLRATGELSLVDWPGFGTCDPPDFEVFSKALNGGQFPLSVVAFSERARSAYVTGIYGNTMSFNPKAARVGCAALRSMTPDRRANIVRRGDELLDALNELVAKYPTRFERAAGSGLLAAIHVNTDVEVTGAGGLEERCRRAGLNAVHGGSNALRFTPWFDMSADEVTLLVDTVEGALLSWLRENGDDLDDSEEFGGRQKAETDAESTSSRKDADGSAEAGVKKSSAVSWTMRKVRSTAERSDTPFFVDADCNPNDEECHYAH